MTDEEIKKYLEENDKLSDTELNQLEQLKEVYELGRKHGVIDVLDKIRAEIMDCLKALDDIEKSGFNIYLPNEMSGRRLSYQQCIGFIDKYKAESEE